MSDSIELHMKMLTDENGFIDRECPQDDCLFSFKIDAGDWQARIDGNEMYCPRCGHRDGAGRWWTARQNEAIEANAMSAGLGLASDLLDEIFGDFARELNRTSANVSAVYEPGLRPEYADLPIEQTSGWATEITCNQCGTRFSVIGNAYFCPCCGKDLTTNAVFDSLASYRRRINDLDKLNAWFISNYGAEEAERQIGQQREDIMKSLVGTFESYAKNRYVEMGGTLPRGNVFQRVNDGSECFRTLTGHGYNDFIGNNGVLELGILVNRRHLLTHGNGIVDDRYLRNSGDTSYELGQRIVVNNADLTNLLNLIDKIIHGLSQLP